jgi:PqqD family protein of HPr-rel-A system
LADPTAARFAPLPDGSVLMAPLGLMTACYLRRTGATHLVVDPAPQILHALETGPADAAALVERLSESFDLSLDDLPDHESGAPSVTATIAQALGELEALGLVRRLDD